MIDPTSLRRRAPAIDRSSDRVVAVSAIAVAVAFLVAALLSVLLPAVDRHGAWLPLHLALAGGATTAIAGVMPFFAAAFAAAPPSDARLRFAAVTAVAVGALGASIGVVAPSAVGAGIGGSLFVAGVALTGVATIRPLGRALGPSRGLVSRGYVIALTEVAAGALLATLYATGWAPLVTSWASVKPAHAWLNLVGFVSLVVATTLLHFFPTVIGARIVVRPSARLTVGGPGRRCSARRARAGRRLGRRCSDRGARRGRRVRGDRGQRRPDLADEGALDDRPRLAPLRDGQPDRVAGVVRGGHGDRRRARPRRRFRRRRWAVEAVGGPLVAGWVGLAILGSASHLLPAVGPGDPATHARQRRLLGRFAGTRLLVANAGVAGIAIGWPLHLEVVAAVGAALLALGLGSTAVLLVGAFRVGSRNGIGPDEPESGRARLVAGSDTSGRGLRRHRWLIGHRWEPRPEGVGALPVRALRSGTRTARCQPAIEGLPIRSLRRLSAAFRVRLPLGDERGGGRGRTAPPRRGGRSSRPAGRSRCGRGRRVGSCPDPAPRPCHLACRARTRPRDR